MKAVFVYRNGRTEYREIPEDTRVWRLPVLDSSNSSLLTPSMYPTPPPKEIEFRRQIYRDNLTGTIYHVFEETGNK